VLDLLRLPPPRPPVKAVAVGIASALIVGLVFDIGPWSHLTGRLSGTADAQESPQPMPGRDLLPAPSEADKAALRYFAREGDVNRLQAELRRLRALYPTWQPPRDLLDPEGEDTEIQEIYDLAGQQRFEEARAALAARRQRDPGYEPPADLVALLETATTREALREASDAQDYREVLRLAEDNESLLTCQDVDSIWRVAQAFAATGMAQRAFDAYAYVIDNCLDEPGVRASTLQKAAADLDANYLTQLYDLGKNNTAGQADFDNAHLSIVRGALARGGADASYVVPADWLTFLADEARTGADLNDAMLVGFYLYRHGNPAEAAQWFRFALDNGLGAEAAEAYIIALRATGNRENEFLAREVAYQWREQTPELMEAYLDAMATVLTADRTGENSIEDVEQTSVDRYAPEVIRQRDANGAQALGWYAYNTCQFIIAEEWFISSANWAPTEAALYGLALSRLRLGDKAGFEEVIDEWGSLYPSLIGLVEGTDVDPSDPTTGAIDDPTEQSGVTATDCDVRSRDPRQSRFVDGRRRTDLGSERIMFTEAGSLSAAAPVTVRALASRPAGQARPATPRNLLQQVQGAAPASEPPGLTRPQPVDPTPVPAEPRVVPTRPATTTPLPTARPQAAGPVATEPLTSKPSPVVRRVRSGQSTTGTGKYDQPEDVDAAVRRIVSEPRPRRRVSSARSSGSSGGCGSSAAFHAGRMSAAQANSRGYCLMELKRPVEAAEAFRYAQAHATRGSSVASDAAYGATLAAISLNQTNEASTLAASAPMSRARRTELEIQILTQRAVTASSDENYTAALHHLEQRNRIAPMQKDLMVLQGYAYQAAGDYEAAERMFQAANQSAGTAGSQRAAFGAYRRRYPAPNRPYWGGDYR